MNKVKKQNLSSESILNLGQQMFSEKGYRGTSIQKIAKKLHVSKPALYYYFKNKMEILTTLHEKSFEELKLYSNEKINSDLTTKERFMKLVENHAYYVARHTKLVKIFFQEEKEIPPKAIRALKENRKRYVGELIALYEQGIREGSFRNTNPAVATLTILGACNWLYMWYSPKGRLKEDEMAKLINGVLSLGYLADTSRAHERNESI